MKKKMNRLSLHEGNREEPEKKNLCLGNKSLNEYYYGAMHAYYFVVFHNKSLFSQFHITIHLFKTRLLWNTIEIIFVEKKLAD